MFDGKIDSTNVTKQNVEKSILSVIPKLLQAGVSAIVINCSHIKRDDKPKR
jgi:hypothetical protein